MAISAASTGGLALYLSRRGRQLRSRVLRSEGIHAAADSLIALGVVAAVVAGGVGFHCHAVRSRGEAGHVRVDLHIHVAPDLTIVEGHRIAEAVEAEIRRLDLGIAEVLVHLGADRTVA